MIGPPKVINKTVDGKLLEPYEVSLYFIVYRELEYIYLLIY
jgi:predicted membrane GTPase involved in stress response